MGQGKRSSAKQCNNNSVAVGILVVLSATGVMGWLDVVMAVNTRGQL